jgi:hypothetical protein
MAVGSGLAAQVGFVVETTAGTRAVPTSFVEFNSESLQLAIERIERRGLKAGRRLRHGWAVGTRQAAGQVAFDLSAETVGVLWRACLGAVTSTTSGSGRLHTFTPGDLPSMTVQVGKPDVTGTVRAFDYVGCRVNSFELSASPNEFVTMSLDLVGEDELLNQSLASASYSQSKFFTYVNGKLEIAGSEVCVDNVSVTGSNGLAVYHQICSTAAGKPTIKEADFRDYGGTFTADFKNLTDYQRYVNGTEAALTLEFDAGTNAKLTITGNVRFDGETPTVGGPEIVKQTMPFVFVSGTSDAATFQVALLNTDTNP